MWDDLKQNQSIFAQTQKQLLKNQTEENNKEKIDIMARI